MALVHVNYFSEALKRNVNYIAILPVDKRTVDGETPWTRADKPFKTLYLLHGIHGCEVDWLTGSRIKRWAQERSLAVIMPAGENKFYNDLDPSHDWFEQYIGQELVEHTRSLFPLSTDRQDTYIAGLSMGGYGSLCAGLRYPETFGRVGAFSAGIFESYPPDDNVVGVVGRRSLHVACQGPEEDYKGSRNDVFALADSGAELKPEFFMACGTSDFFLTADRKFSNYLKEQGYQVDYHEDAGGHEWDFWDKYLLVFLNWLPLDQK